MALAYEPENDAHALVESIFFIDFDPEMGRATLEKFASATGPLLDLLPTKKPIKKIEFSVSSDGSSFTEEADAGVEFIKPGDGDSVQWVLRVIPEKVSLHCLSYTRWTTVWTFASDVFEALGDIAGDQAIKGVGLKNIDKFRFRDSDISNYSISQLFEPESPFIAPILNQAGPFWHCHTGWFDIPNLSGLPAGNGQRTLNQLNLGSATEQDAQDAESKSTLFAKIDHTLLFQTHESPQPLRDFLSHWMNSIYSHFHEKNKSLLCSLLNSDIQKRINLKVGEQ